MNVTLLPPGLPLIDEVARRVELPGVPLAEARVVFPGKPVGALLAYVDRGIVRRVV